MYIYIYILIFFFCCAGSSSLHRLSLVVVSRGSSLVAMLGLLIAVASLDTEHRLLEHGLQWLLHASSVVVARGPSCFEACGIFLGQGSNPCTLHCRKVLYHCTTWEAPEQISPKYCYNLSVFCLCFFLIFLWFQVLLLVFNPLWVFFCIWESVLTSFFYM